MARKRAVIDEVPMELTPMIDVVFLLLIFFMVTLKFKVLEGKLQTYLPKDVGVNASPIDDLLDKVEIHIDALGDDEYAFRVRLSGRVMPDLETFYSTLANMQKAAAPDDLKCTLYPGRGVEYEHVVRVVDEILRAEVTDVTFAGVPLDS